MNRDRLKPHQRIDAELDIPYRNVADLLHARCSSDRDRPFVIVPGSDEEVSTYGEFVGKVDHVCGFLTQSGLVKGDRINILIPNSMEFLLLYFAALRLGITVVPINEDLSPPEILFIVLDSQSKALFYHESLDFKVRQVREEFGRGMVLEKFGSAHLFGPLDADAHPGSADVTLFDEAVIIYTSGTTGNPKGVVLTHLNLLADAKALSEWFEFSASTRTLCILPLFHNNGQVVTLLAPLYQGGSTVIARGKTSLMAFWGLVDAYEVTWTSVMAAILSILNAFPVKRTDRSLKGIVCGGQILNPAVQEEFESRFGVPIYEGFGLTETTSFACFNDYPAERRKRGSIGRALSVNEMRILGPDDTALPANTDGEICVRGYNVANEYLGLPDRNEESFRNGWFHTGDYGYVDDDDYFFFRGRKDFLIIKGGENIFPAELENVLHQHEAVEEAAVIGIPDRLLGQDLAAFVKLRDGASTSPEDLAAYCRPRIAKFKQPKRLFIVDELADMEEIPKGATKKVLYKELMDYYESNYLEA